MREEGYYWVKQKGDQFEVAHYWQGKFFLTDGQYHGKIDDDFEVINENKILSPDETK